MRIALSNDDASDGDASDELSAQSPPDVATPQRSAVCAAVAAMLSAEQPAAPGAAATAAAAGSPFPLARPAPLAPSESGAPAILGALPGKLRSERGNYLIWQLPPAA